MAVHVYSLEVVKPSPHHVLPAMQEWLKDNPYHYAFVWPRVRNYLSLNGAMERAELLRSYGAKVTIHKSDPVTFPSDVRHIA